jgi:hypothetical protein
MLQQFAFLKFYAFEGSVQGSDLPEPEPTFGPRFRQRSELNLKFGPWFSKESAEPD